MMNEGSVAIEVYASLDGQKRCEIRQRRDGLFVYVEETFFTEDEREFGGGIYDHWSPTHFSGLLGSLEDARADAIGQLPWLKTAAALS
jgi:hypothetical protein